MKVTVETAARTLHLIDFAGSPEAARREARIQLEALGPYTDRRLEKVYDVLRVVCRHNDRPAILAALARIATPDQAVTR